MIFAPTRDMGYQEYFLRQLQTGEGFVFVNGKGNPDDYDALQRLFEQAKEHAATLPIALPAPKS